MSTPQNVDGVTIVTAYSIIPYNVIAEDISEYMKNDFFNELGEIVKLYEVYHQGAEVVTEGTNADYTPSDVRYKKTKNLIDEEARFLFSNTPDFTVNKNANASETEKAQNTVINDFLTKVLNKNHMSDKLVKAAKDCFIGKRVACILNFNQETGITLTFLTSLEFMYEYSTGESLSKFVAFYTLIDSSNKKDKRINKKTYAMHDDGYCYVTERVYDGLGTMLEETVPEIKTLFTYVPAVVILNDGLTNESKGESEAESLQAYEGLYSKLANSDVDAERKSMNPVRYTVDADPESTKTLSTAPGAYWDLQSDSSAPDTRTASVGTLESSMPYSVPLKTTLDRLNNQMHAQVSVPDINSEQLQGVITSGKTLKALYWSLIVRCNEKMKSWQPALEFIVETILDGAILYPECTTKYTEEPIPKVNFDIEVENNYPLPEDETEEKNNDMAEVAAQTMSRKSYMKKWRKLTDEEVDEELKQIVLEKQMMEQTFMPQDGATAGDMTGAEDISTGAEDTTGAEGDTGAIADEDKLGDIDDSEIQKLLDDFEAELNSGGEE